MYTLIRHKMSPMVTLREAVTFTMALGVAETFYKFNSFTLECAAFLATWIALSGLIDLGIRLLPKGNASNQHV